MMLSVMPPRNRPKLTDLEWQQPDKMNNTTAEHHVIGIDGQMADNLTNGNGVT